MVPDVTNITTSMPTVITTIVVTSPPQQQPPSSSSSPATVPTITATPFLDTIPASVPDTPQPTLTFPPFTLPPDMLPQPRLIPPPRVSPPIRPPGTLPTPIPWPNPTHFHPWPTMPKPHGNYYQYYYYCSDSIADDDDNGGIYNGDEYGTGRKANPSNFGYNRSHCRKKIKRQKQLQRSKKSNDTSKKGQYHKKKFQFLTRRKSHKGQKQKQEHGIDNIGHLLTKPNKYPYPEQQVKHQDNVFIGNQYFNQEPDHPTP
jgi:hypothetical protein